MVKCPLLKGNNEWFLSPSVHIYYTLSATILLYFSSFSKLLYFMWMLLFMQIIYCWYSGLCLRPATVKYICYCARLSSFCVPIEVSKISLLLYGFWTVVLISFLLPSISPAKVTSSSSSTAPNPPPLCFFLFFWQGRINLSVCQSRAQHRLNVKPFWRQWMWVVLGQDFVGSLPVRKTSLSSVSRPAELLHQVFVVMRKDLGQHEHFSPQLSMVRGVDTSVLHLAKIVRPLEEASMKLPRRCWQNCQCPISTDRHSFEAGNGN